MEEYYVSQAGSGLAHFSGLRYQRGAGFFGSLIKGTVFPLLKKVLPFLGRHALSAGSNLLSELKSGENIKTAAKRTLRKEAGDIASDAMLHFQKQSGTGIRRRRRRTTVAPRVTVRRRKIVKGRRRKRTVRRRRRTLASLF